MTAKTLKSLLMIFLFACSGTLIGCQASYIPTTRVADNPENRAVYNVVMAYRRAMEQRDARVLKALISRKYFENSGTTERGDDDYGYAQLLEKVLPKLKENIKAVHLRIMVTNIQIDGSRASANYEYFYKFKYVEGGKEGWKQKNDFNRLELAKENGSWKIISGL